MFGRLRLRHVGYVACLGLLMAYQNCAQDPSDTSSDSVASYQEGLPFAFNTKIDTISYMSCMDITDAVQTRGYYTFRVGAYKPPDIGGTYAGIGLTDAYLTATKYYSTTDRARALSQSDANNGALLTLSVRNSANLQQPWLLNGSTAQPGYDVDTLIPSLTADEVAGPLAALTSGQYRNYFPSQDDERLVEASLRAYGSKGDMDNLRQTLSGAYLTVGYTATPDETDSNLRSTSDYTGGTDTKFVLGTGYEIQFGEGPVLASSAPTVGPARALGGITEHNLDTGARTTGAWDCAHHFMVVRPGDLGLAGVSGKCNTTIDQSPVGNAAAAKELDAIRRVLPVEDWFVDVVNHCVVPKSTIGDYCYGANIGTRVIQYSQGSCDGNDASTTTACPQYVTVCIRN